jgi:radical SAM protein with 4Fe4S-binding SPASM domain
VDCPHIPELSYGEFGERLQEKIKNDRFPLSGSLELTFRCNLRCAHCYASFGHEGVPGKTELSYAEVCDILDQIAEAGCLWLLLTGGEPLVRRDFVDIYTYAKRKGFLVTLFTNGTLITPEIADVLVELPPFKVEITLYGMTQETYERVTGVPGSHARCMRGIELLVERGLPLKLKSMLMTLNKHEIWDMQAYAEKLGVDFRFDPLLNAGMEGFDAPKHLRIQPSEAVQFDLADRKRIEGFQAFSEKFIRPLRAPEYLYNCGAGIGSFHIDPFGELCLCITAREPHVSLRQVTFQEGWDTFLKAAREQKRTREVKCMTCPLISLCGQCPGWAQLENGDPEEPVEYLCQIAHARAEAFKIPL